MENKFKIGDKVFHILYGWGNIKDVIDDGVMIYFDDMINQVSLFKKHFKLISFTEYTLEGFSQERPAVRPEVRPDKGQIVWVRGGATEHWSIGHFMAKEDDKFYTSDTPFRDRFFNWGSEITTTNPYENEQ